MPARDRARALLVVEGGDGAELDGAVLGEVLGGALERLGHLRGVDNHRLLAVSAALLLALHGGHLVAVGGVIPTANVEKRHLVRALIVLAGDHAVGRGQDGGQWPVAREGETASADLYLARQRLVCAHAGGGLRRVAACEALMSASIATATKSTRGR